MAEAEPDGAKTSHKKSDVALLVIDVINDLEFPGGERVLPWAEKMVGRLRPTAAAARSRGVPIVYVNDNFGHWRSNFRDVFDHCTRDGARGAAIARAMRPADDDYFVLKPKHSAFFATSLVPLLEFLGTRRIVMAGVATNLCVLFSAHDAYMHEYDITVLSDCCAAESDADHDGALDQLERFLKIRVCRSDEIEWTATAT